MLVVILFFVYIDILIISTSELIAYSIAEMTDEYEPYPLSPSALIESIFASGFWDTISSTIISPCSLFPTTSSSINETRSITFGFSDTPVSINAITLSTVCTVSDTSVLFNNAIALLSLTSAASISMSFVSSGSFEAVTI